MMPAEEDSVDWYQIFVSQDVKRMIQAYETVVVCTHRDVQSRMPRARMIVQISDDMLDIVSMARHEIPDRKIFIVSNNPYDWVSPYNIEKLSIS